MEAESSLGSQGYISSALSSNPPAHNCTEPQGPHAGTQLALHSEPDQGVFKHTIYSDEKWQVQK